jgi:serine/threonine-protein kinase
VVAELSETDPQADPLIGRKLDGRYEVLGRLGEGGVGVVYKGRQTQLGRLVAIKVLHQDAAAMGEWRKRFEREARALSALAHPNIVSVTDSGIDRGVPFLVMELLQGKTLSDLLKEGPLPLWRALDIGRQLLRGLAFAHSKAIVHRDLKPANVFLQALPDQADHVRLLDFGMAKFLDGSSSRNVGETLTRVGAVFGTPAYMSPEQAKGGPADKRTDVYAAGALLFELLAGERPFPQDTYEGVVMAHLTQPVPSLAKVRPELTVASSFQPLVEKAMAKKPASRFKDATALLAALDAVIEKLPPEAMSGGRAEKRRRSTARTVAATPATTTRSRSRRLILVLGGFTAAVAAVGIYLVREGATPVETTAPPVKPARKPAPPSAPPAASRPPAPALASPPPKVEPPAKAEPPTKAEPPAKAEPPTKMEPAPTPSKETQAKTERQPRSRPRNPWQAPVPRALKPIRDRLAHGARMSQKGLRPAYEYARENPGDPRPWLLLGHAYAALDWFSDSVDRYVRADQVDSTCRGDPQMLADLLDAAAHPTAGRSAARAIRDIYGAEAIPAVDKAMKRAAGDRQTTERLTRLRESLPR